MKTRIAAAFGAALLAASGSDAVALSLGGDFAADYTVASLGTPAGFSGPLGGLTFAPGDPNTLWIGDDANTASGAIYAVPVVRDVDDTIIALGATRTLVTTAPNIDGGVDFAPNGTLFFSTFSDNRIGQVLPGSSAPDRFVELTALGVASSTGTLRFVPQGLPGAGRLKVASYNGDRFYDMPFILDTDGTYVLGNVTSDVAITGGPEGIVYVLGGNPGFATDSLLISEYDAGEVGVYEIDANGDPIPGTRRDFLTGLTGAEGGVSDPLTGDFVFSTFGGGNQVVVVSGFTAPTGGGGGGGGTGAEIPLPGAAALMALGLGALGAVRRRRRG